MTNKMLDSATLSTYCESIAMMLSAGIQTDEALHLFSENMKDAYLQKVCNKVYTSVVKGNSLAASMEETGAFPRYALDMIAAGEFSGHLENTLTSLGTYYSEEARLFSKAKSAVAYPAALLIIMALILLFAVSVILPVFIDVYNGFTGGLTAGSYGYINASIIIGWIALFITLFCALVVIVAVLVARTPSGQTKLIHFLEKTPFTRDPLYHMAVSRFASTLATHVASGTDSDSAMKETMSMVTHKKLKAKLEAAYADMIDPKEMKSLAQAIYDNTVFDSVYARMLIVGSKSGSLEVVLQNLSEAFFDESIMKIDNVIDGVEPALAGFLTISIGATLIAVMLPLIGIMGSIG